MDDAVGLGGGGRLPAAAGEKLAVSLAAYWWAQRSGFRTEQLDRALAEDYPSVAAPTYQAGARPKG
ncbi:hypothetical protein [Streptomyces sp. HC307]|uniref:hypothetical protein n=1 Tax=Streptomyces flavusporus TaxID=3385496 RepID=UPI0039171491